MFSAHPVTTVARERLLMPLLRLPRTQQTILAAGNRLHISYRHCSPAVDAPSTSPTPQSRPSRRRRSSRGPRAGHRAPDALLKIPDRTEQTRLFDHLHGPPCTALLFDTEAGTPAGSQHMLVLAERLDQRCRPDLTTHLILARGDGPAAGRYRTVLLDPTPEACHRYGVHRQAIYLIPPDGCIGLRIPHLDEQALTDPLDALLRLSRLPVH